VVATLSTISFVNIFQIVRGVSQGNHVRKKMLMILKNFIANIFPAIVGVENLEAQN
jgi:hypothetical protein